MAIATVNPATGQLVKSFEPLTSAEIESKLQKATDTFATYRNTTFAYRAERMLKAAAILEQDKEAFAKVMTTEMGKTLRSAVDEAVKCAWVCRYYAENAERFLADEPVETGRGAAISATSPWARCWWSCRGIIRSGRCSVLSRRRLMAGNVGLLKHASNRAAMRAED